MVGKDQVRRSRRQLLWLLAGFALCQAVLAVAIDGWLLAVRDPELARKLDQLRARRAEVPDRPLVLALGSSRTAFGLDARGLSTSADGPPALVFNFGLMGGGSLLDLVVLRRVVADGLRPDLLYVEVVPNMVADVGERLMEEKLLDGARLQAGEVVRLWPHYRQPWRLVGGWCLGRTLPCYRHQAELRDLLAFDTPASGRRSEAGYIDSHGWCPRLDRVTDEGRRVATALAREQNDGLCACAAVAPEAVGALEALLAECRREGIPVALVRMPEGAPFRAPYTATARAALAGLLARLRAEWGVTVVDAQTWVEDDGFWDTHHLLPDGARRFTERFGREALRPALTGLRPAARAARP